MSEGETKSIVEPSHSNDDSPSVKERASHLWNSLRNSVSTTTREVKETLYKASDEMSTYSKPICLQGKHCPQASDREHMRLFRHLCPYGLQCTSQGFTTHYNDFVHSSVMAEEAIIVDPNDNRSKATNNNNSNNTNKNVSGSTGGILDFLDDSKNDNVKSLKHMINFPSTNATAAFASSSSMVGLCLTSLYQRNAPITSLTPVRVCYGMQQWNVAVYHQTAQWPQPNEFLTHEEEIFIRDFNKQHQTRANDFKNDIHDDRYVGISSDDINRKNEKSIADKAKDFFDELFGTVRAKNSNNNNNQNDDDDHHHNTNHSNENKSHKSDAHDNEDESAGIVTTSENNKVAEKKRAEQQQKTSSGDSSYLHQRLPDEEDDVRLLGHDGEDTSAI